jgi:hypothetical protein
MNGIPVILNLHPARYIISGFIRVISFGEKLFHEAGGLNTGTGG